MLNIANIEELENELSVPSQGALDTLKALAGDVVILGAGGKIGPTLARMVRRGLDAIGQSSRKVIAVSRFSTESATIQFQQHGIETISCDLLDRKGVERLPLADNVLFLAGQKFGTDDQPERTWAMNTLVPAYIAEHYRQSKIVAFSTGCVYPLVPVSGRGATETDQLGPPGDYANSCVGRERIFTYFSKCNGTEVLLFRLCYAIDLRYGVLYDVASKVAKGQPIDVTMGEANVIWQGDANARAIESLAHVASPAIPLNITGLERVSIRSLAEQFGELLHRKPTIVGKEASHAWVWDASRSYELFGPPRVSIDQMIQATARWIRDGGASLGKPTHFEVVDGKY